MQIKMRAVLSQAELEEAVRLFVRQELPSATDQNITVTFEDDKDGNLTAAVDIDSADGGEAPSQKPKTTRKKAIQGAKDATVVAEQASEEKPAETTANVQEESESAADASKDLPWKEDAAGTDQPIVKEDKPVTQPNEIPAETTKIFPDAVSSAAPSAPKPDTAAAAKSLFANLTKPTQ
ncbi:hypothetical protein [Mesorhizobium sp. M4B.F.Ca.ET.058.02.1.1]|uniref:hypothetical protein n=1 Tax=Mesorhizobium sp. M4B.F.Ca.ET.058.02.1.1 TaxID=2493675 RepID=UPI000F74C813|nr:hypothetical protein [Mesorhizobium sp. M4B.F.Ca.ET.058.02.1.1]AZO48038.1 hypothetical protein EJ073_09560 [Mesorhizobium sp. M4B.F.Ca.ET.058.02.1.1]